MANFRQRQHIRWSSVPAEDRLDTGEDVHVSHKSTQPDNPTAGGGNGMRDRIDERDPHGAQLGANWAGSHPEAPFRKTVGLMPDVNGHVSCFERSVNLSGGVNQPGYYTSDCAPGTARAVIRNFKRRYEVSGQGSGDTFQDRQHRRWSGKGG